MFWSRSSYQARRLAKRLTIRKVSPLKKLIPWYNTKLPNAAIWIPSYSGLLFARPGLHHHVQNLLRCSSINSRRPRKIDHLVYYMHRLNFGYPYRSADLAGCIGLPSANSFTRAYTHTHTHTRRTLFGIKNCSRKIPTMIHTYY